MTIILIGVVLSTIFALAAWRLARNRAAAKRRRTRRNQGSARQKAWTMVFGRRTQKRLSFDPADHTEE